MSRGSIRRSHLHNAPASLAATSGHGRRSSVSALGPLVCDRADTGSTEAREAPTALRALARSGRALEINTSGWLPLDASLLNWWHAEGGTTVSFGSDAHDPASIGREFASAAAMARAVGFGPPRNCGALLTAAGTKAAAQRAVMAPFYDGRRRRPGNDVRIVHAGHRTGAPAAAITARPARLRRKRL
jgi:hypothetical protein